MDNLETNKLCRDWVGLNWIGESSSLTGTDAIAFPGLGAEDRKPNLLNWSQEKTEMKQFYRRLACVLEGISPDGEPEGKYIATDERLSIPELVKRLVTHEDIADKLEISPLGKGFGDVYRRPEKITETEKGRWTGWFMGDGDKIGDRLKELAQQSDGEIEKFSRIMREWGRYFARDFPTDLGRVIYAGGDDFLGVIYSEKDKVAIKAEQAYQWLLGFPQQWQKNKQPLAEVTTKPITVSVGFIWAAASVPQRDILQHCREAEKLAKSQGRDRVTIRVLFNSGQYVQWTCPWDYLDILDKYQDLEGNYNWNHIYTDLAQLESRNAFYVDKKTFDRKFFFDFFDLYFPGEGTKLGDSKNKKLLQHVVGYSDDDQEYERIEKTINWMRDLIKIGFQLCSNI
jgi:CRISPR-associated protein Cmr2